MNFRVGDQVRVRPNSGAPSVLYGEEGPIVRVEGDEPTTGASGHYYVVRLQDDEFPVLEADLEPAQEAPEEEAESYQ